MLPNPYTRLKLNTHKKSKNLHAELYCDQWHNSFIWLACRGGLPSQESVLPVYSNEFPTNLLYIWTVPNSEISDVNRRCSCYSKRSVPVKSHPIPLFAVNDACNKSTTTSHAICSRSQDPVCFSCTATEKVNSSQIFSETRSRPKFGLFLEDRHFGYDSSIGAIDKT